MAIIGNILSFARRQVTTDASTNTRHVLGARHANQAAKPGLHAAQMPGFRPGKGADAFAGQSQAQTRVAVPAPGQARADAVAAIPVPVSYTHLTLPTKRIV